MYYVKPETWTRIYGDIYMCDHPLYNRCTLFKEKGFGLAVIQQRYDPKTKHTWWDYIDPWLANDIYLNTKFSKVFKERAARRDTNDLYPTICVRQLMWLLRMPPLPKDIWETRF